MESRQEKREEYPEGVGRPGQGVHGGPQLGAGALQSTGNVETHYSWTADLCVVRGAGGGLETAAEATQELPHEEDGGYLREAGEEEAGHEERTGEEGGPSPAQLVSRHSPCQVTHNCPSPSPTDRLIR